MADPEPTEQSEYSAHSETMTSREEASDQLQNEVQPVQENKNEDAQKGEGDEPKGSTPPKTQGSPKKQTSSTPQRPGTANIRAAAGGDRTPTGGTTPTRHTKHSILSPGSSRPATSPDSSMDSDPAKQKEREEKVRMAQQRQIEDRQRKLEEILDAQKKAQEFRERQQEERKRKLIDMRRREEEHRNLVEERRKKMLELENVVTCPKERRQSFLKRSAEKDVKLNDLRDKRNSTGFFGFGSRSRRMVCDTIDHSKRAASHGSLLRPSPNNTLEPAETDPNVLVQRRAVSACSLNRKSTAADKNGGLRSPPEPAYGPKMSKSPASSMKRISMSTSNLSHRKTKDNTLTSDLQMGGSVSDVRLHAATQQAKGRSKSADTGLRRSHGDLKRSIDRLAQPKTVRESVRTPSSSRQAPPKIQPAVPRVIPRDVHVKPTNSTANKNIMPTKGPVKAVHKGTPGKKPTALPLKEGSPAREVKPKEEIKNKDKEVKIKANADVKPKEKVEKKSVQKEEKKDREKKSPVTEVPKTPTPTDEHINKVSEEDLYKAKMAERRKQAREKAEREAEEERMKNEQLRLEEEERKRKKKKEKTKGRLGHSA